jgi:predicted ester cyclase
MSPVASDDHRQRMTISELNKQRVLEFVVEVLNGGRLELIDDLVARDFIGQLECAGAAIIGPEGVRRFVSHRRIAYPGIYLHVEDQIAEDDRVATRWRATAGSDSQVTGGPGAAGSGGITITRMLAGKQVEAYTHSSWSWYRSLAAAFPRSQRPVSS